MRYPGTTSGLSALTALTRPAVYERSVELGTGDEYFELELPDGCNVVVSTAALDWLIESLEPVAERQSIRDALMAIDATRPVTLDKGDRAWLLGYLDGLEAAGTLPSELNDLHEGLWPSHNPSGG